MQRSMRMAVVMLGPLHVWAWKDSPAGPFVNWHRTVSCGAFDDQTN